MIGEMGSTENCIFDLITGCEIKIFNKNGMRKKSTIRKCATKCPNIEHRMNMEIDFFLFEKEYNS